MSVLAQINAALDTYAHFVEQQVARARKNRGFRAQLLQAMLSVPLAYIAKYRNDFELLGADGSCSQLWTDCALTSANLP